MKGDIDRAISDFSKAIQLNPDNAQAYYNRAVARFNKGMYDESWEDLQRIGASDIKIDPVFLERLKKKTGRRP